VASGARDPQRGPPGKLKAAARHWANQRFGGSDELDEDLAVLGLADQIKADQHAPFGIWPENETAVRTFLELEAHWTIGKTADGTSRLVLDNRQIKDTLELMGVKRREWPEVFNGLKVMETAALLELCGETE
jgi:hypothetical protein